MSVIFDVIKSMGKFRVSMKSGKMILVLMVLYSATVCSEIEPPTKSMLSGAILTVGKSYMDPGPDYDPNTNLLISITGNSAQQIFESLKVKAVESKICPWSDDGDCFQRVTKESKGIHCLSSPPSHPVVCTINYNLLTQEFINPQQFNAGGDI